MRRLLLVFLLSALPAWAVNPTLANHNSFTTASNAITSTTAGNAMAIITSSANVPGSVTKGAQTATSAGPCTSTVSSLVTCLFYILVLTTETTPTLACNSCGSFNFIAFGEWSSVGGLDSLLSCYDGGSGRCQQNNGATALGLSLSPGYSNVGVMFGFTCAGSSGTPTTSGLTSVSTATPGGNPVIWGITTGITAGTANPTSGCNQTAGKGIGFYGTGTTQQLTSNPNEMDYFAQDSATGTANVQRSGDLVPLYIWCIPTCGITTLTLGAQNAICPAGAQGTTNSSAGQPGICYVIANTSGALTVTFNPSGSPAHFQVAYQDISLSANETIAFDTAATSNCTGSCSEGTTITTPSITPAVTGSLLINFASTLNHVSGPGTGWDCYAYIRSGETNTCGMVTTVNQGSWILNSAAGSTSANVLILTNNDPFQSVVASFIYSSTTTANAPQVFVIHP